MNNFIVEVSTTDNSTRHSCGVYSQSESVNRGGSHTFICDHKEGRYVFVRKLEGSREQQLLTLCEVMVDGIQVSAPTPFMSAAMGTTAMIQTTPSSGGKVDVYLQQFTRFEGFMYAYLNVSYKLGRK